MIGNTNPLVNNNIINRHSQYNQEYMMNNQKNNNMNNLNQNMRNKNVRIGLDLNLNKNNNNNIKIGMNKQNNFMNNMNRNLNLKNNMNNANNMNMINNMNMMNMNNNNINMNNINLIQMMFQMNQMKNAMNPINKNCNKKLNQIIGIESVRPFKISEGIINDCEYDIITQICVEAIKENKDNIALYCTEKIKSKLKGQWFVLIHDLNDGNYEFNFSKIKFDNILKFQYKNKIVYVTPIK